VGFKLNVFPMSSMLILLSLEYVVKMRECVVTKLKNMLAVLFKSEIVFVTNCNTSLK
jgi:hypothetical protein